MKIQIEIPAGAIARKLRRPVRQHLARPMPSQPPRKFDPVAYAAALEILG